MKVWTEKQIRDLIKEQINEDYYFELENAGDSAFRLINRCDNPQTFLIKIEEEPFYE